MAKGAVAKLNVENKIKEAFGEDFIGNIDKKLYVWSEEDGQRVQVCLSLTCPKVLVNTNSTSGAGLDFETMETPSTTANAFKPAEITNEETENIKHMLERLGL